MGGALKEGNKRRFDEPMQVNPAELQVGRKWSTRFVQSGDVSGTGEYDFRIIGRQKVKVPGRRVFCIQDRRQRLVHGQAHSVGALDRARHQRPGPPRAPQFGTTRVLVSARQAVSS